VVSVTGKAFIRNIYSIDVITLGQIISDHYNRFMTLTKLTLPLYNLIVLNKATEKWLILLLIFSLIILSGTHSITSLMFFPNSKLKDIKLV
jgi:hypothetical protein